MKTKNMTREERAMQIWQILIAAAHDRRILTYKHLANHLGFEGAGTMAQMLDYVMRYCAREKLPPLSCLVVNQTTGLPGAGLTSVENLPKEREAVFSHNWYEMYPVQISDFQSLND
nr:hypothetical protein [Herbaspirillum lusitanum]